MTQVARNTAPGPNPRMLPTTPSVSSLDHLYRPAIGVERDVPVTTSPIIDKAAGVSTGGIALSAAEVIRRSVTRPEPIFEPANHPSDYRVAGMDKWEGRVTHVDDDWFTAELTPLTKDSGPMVQAEFEKTQLDPDTVCPGDVIYVTVRTTYEYGLQSRTSAVRLRRLGAWTAEEVAGVHERAQRRARDIATKFE